MGISLLIFHTGGEYKTALLIYKCIYGLAPSFIPCGVLSADVTLRRPFQPPVRQPAAAAGSTNEDVLRRSEFPGQRSCCVEQSVGCATFTGHVTGTF